MSAILGLYSVFSTLELSHILCTGYVMLSDPLYSTRRIYVQDRTHLLHPGFWYDGHMIICLGSFHDMPTCYFASHVAMMVSGGSSTAKCLGLGHVLRFPHLALLWLGLCLQSVSYGRTCTTELFGIWLADTSAVGDHPKLPWHAILSRSNTRSSDGIRQTRALFMKTCMMAVVTSRHRRDDACINYATVGVSGPTNSLINY